MLRRHTTYDTNHSPFVVCMIEKYEVHVVYHWSSGSGGGLFGVSGQVIADGNQSKQSLEMIFMEAIAVT